jgi:hypothetical protein
MGVSSVEGIERNNPHPPKKKKKRTNRKTPDRSQSETLYEITLNAKFD